MADNRIIAMPVTIFFIINSSFADESERIIPSLRSDDETSYAEVYYNLNCGQVSIFRNTPVQENPTQVVKLSTDSRVLATLFA